VSAGTRAERRRLLHPGAWPVRWRLALASASLTLAILVVFAAVIGHLAGQRVRSDFNRELQDAVRSLAREVRVQDTLTETVISQEPNLDDFVQPNDAAVRIFDANGALIDSSSGAPNLGPPITGIREIRNLRVATAALQSAATGRVAGYVQYARSEEHVDSTIRKLWLFIVAGVLGGTLLATLAGLAIANRAMRPIASLTATARKIAATRDPSRRMPQPAVHDEVGELAATLDEMLRALDAAQAERERAMQQQREFVADASHELRTPLTSVIANLELLQASLNDARQSEDREMADSALRSSRRMSRLVADLLLLARADAGRFGERQLCDLGEIAEHAAAEVAPVARDHRLNVENGRPIPVEGNADELHRMVVNLLDNAVRHTPPGSSIELRLGRDSGRGEALIEVADDGPGIPADQRRQVFERFVRGDGPADTATVQGTGLGLAIVRAVARSHGGEVEADQSPLGGALFRVHLPLANAEEGITPSLGTL
jgi:two-component system, OmpR family, sensor kinase